MRLINTIAILLLSINTFAQVSNPSSESMGTAPSNTAIATHESANGFDIDPFTYGGTGELRNSSSSSGYAGASGLANVFLTNNASKTFIIDGIQAGPMCDNLNMTFGVFKSTTAENGASLVIEYSTTGTTGTWTSAGSVALPTGSGTATWSLKSISAMPGTVTSIRFTNTATNTNQFRLDDVTLTATGPSCLSLPIDFSSLNVVKQTTSTLLSFSTASERNNDFFAIERSNDGRTFEEIGQVKGAGTSQAPQYYTFTDKQPLPGKNYYRLRQVDFDGKVAYSAVVNVVFSQSGDIRLAPSPATDLVLVQLDQPATEDGLWQVFDVAGRLVQSGNWAAETDVVSIHVGTLAEGMYTFRFTMGQTVQVKQFRKQ
jgi:hypothetical protein